MDTTLRTNEMQTSRRHQRPQWLAHTLQVIFSLLILSIGIGAATWLTLSAKKPATRDNVDLAPEVMTFAVENFLGELDLDVSGLVVPYREIKVAAEVAGRVAVKSKDFQAGKFVREGTELLKIDSREYEIELQRLTAEVRQSERMFEETNQELAGAVDRRDVAQREFAVQEAEYNRRRGIANVLSQSELNLAEQNYLASRAALQTHENTVVTLEKRKARMQAAIELSKLQTEKAALDLQRTTIKAPVDGVIVSEQVEQGDFVQRGQQLMLFEDTQRAEVRCNLTLNQLKWIFENSPGSQLLRSEKLSTVYELPKTLVAIFPANDSGAVWRGTLDRFDGIGLDERTRTVPCTVVVENPIAEGPQGRQALVRGTYVKCRIVIAADQMVDQGKKFVRIPEVAVQPGGYVWLSRDGKLEQKPVAIVDHVTSETEAGMQDFVVVQLTDTSIQPGERVIVSPMASPVEGTEIREVASTEAPTPATEPSPAESDSTELSANREGARP